MSAPTVRTGAPVTGRLGFAFSVNGRHAASVSVCGADPALETWRLDPREATRCLVPGVEVGRDAGLLPLDDGTLLLFQRVDNDRHEVLALPAPAHSGPAVSLGTMRTYGGYLLPAPARWGSLGLAVTLDDADRSTIWRVDGSTPCLEPLLRLPGALSGGTWIDEDAGLAAVNLTRPGYRPSGIVVDLRRGSWRRVWSVSDTSTDRILCYARSTRRLVVSSNASGEPRLGWGVLGERAVRFPDALHRPGYPRHVLTFDDAGERLLVHETAGALSRLYVYTPADDRLLPLAGPRGRVSSPASWTGDLIRLPFSHPAQPPTVATIRLGDRPRWSTPRWSLPREPAPAGIPAPADAELVELPGPTGPVEAVAYGGPNWQQRRQLVVALHGGPLSGWRFEFDPLFQQLGASGVAVLAPSYRGSTGYGNDHRHAALGSWGGPDLDDVRTIGRALGRERAHRGLAAPIVLGVSYGAFLALLAACTEPPDWSGCVALAPFLSASGPQTAVGAPVRRRIGADDPTAPRDVLRLCASLCVPLLLVHGSRDERVPVEHSRMLRQRLLELGRTPGVDLDYLEPDTDHAGVVAQWPPRLLHRIVRFCLTRTAVRPAGPDRGEQSTARTWRG